MPVIRRMSIVGETDDRWIFTRASGNPGLLFHRAFFLTQQGLSGPEMGEIFVRALAGMVRRALRQPGPFIFTVSRSGVFSRVL
jgi:hypothetical protein